MGATWSWWAGAPSPIQYDQAGDMNELCTMLFQRLPQTHIELVNWLERYEQLRSKVLESRLDLLYARLASLELDNLILRKQQERERIAPQAQSPSPSPSPSQQRSYYNP